MRPSALAVLIAVSLSPLAPPSLGAQPSAGGPRGPAWVPVYKHDAQGRPLGGSKERLVEAIRRGQEVRVAWGVRHPRDSTRSVEHTAPAHFATIVDGTEVFVQVPEHVAHADYWARDQQAPGDPQVAWSAVLGTTGAFNAVFYNRATGAEVRRLPQRVTMTWLVHGAAGGGAGREPPPPLYAPEAPRPLAPPRPER